MIELALDLGSGEVSDIQSGRRAELYNWNRGSRVPLQVSLLVKTKLVHADKVENGDELVQVGNEAVENLTVQKLMEMMGSPNRDTEGFGVILAFKKRNGVVFRFMAETMKLSVDRNPAAPEINSSALQYIATIPQVATSPPEPTLVGSA